MVDAAAGILWVAIAFSGTLALGRTFERERYTDTLRALLLAPADRPAIYVGKLLGIVAHDWRGGDSDRSARRVPVPGAVLSQAPLAHRNHRASGTIGFAAVGTLFAAMLVRARSRDVLLPVLLYPITIPVIIAGVRGTSALPRPILPSSRWPRFWTSLLAFFDVVFLALALWTFEPLMTMSPSRCCNACSCLPPFSARSCSASRRFSWPARRTSPRWASCRRSSTTTRHRG